VDVANGPFDLTGGFCRLVGRQDRQESVGQARREQAAAAVVILVAVPGSLVAEGIPQRRVAAAGLQLNTCLRPDFVLQQQVKNGLPAQVGEDDVVGTVVQSDVSKAAANEVAEEVAPAPEVEGPPSLSDVFLHGADLEEQKGGATFPVPAFAGDASLKG
jgi:hypothetical protein